MRKRSLLLSLAIIFPFAVAQTLWAQDAKQQKEIEDLKAHVAEIEKKMLEVRNQYTDLSPVMVPEGGREYIFGEVWDDGLHFVTRGNLFEIRIGGSVQVDVAGMTAVAKLKEYLAQKGRGEIKNGAELRRAYIYTKGQMYSDFIYKLEGDFSDGKITITDGFLGATNIPVVGTVIVGKEARAFGLDPVPDDKFTLFMEYANTMGFGVGGQLGVAAGNSLLNDRLTWAIHGFQMSDYATNKTIQNNYGMNMRITGVPIYEESGRSLVHQGVSYSYRSASKTTRFMESKESHLAPNFIDTGDIDAKMTNAFNYSAAWCQGPLSLEGEYYSALVDQVEGPSNTYFQGFYVQASYFLTGEYRGEQYITSYGAFDNRAIPNKNFSLSKGGSGAWQVAARYSWMDLDDRDIRGGILGDLTLGLNWYLNPNLRWMLNYIHAQLNGEGPAEILETRFAIDY